jgi:hypothetical protein
LDGLGDESEVAVVGEGIGGTVSEIEREQGWEDLQTYQRGLDDDYDNGDDDDGDGGGIGVGNTLVELKGTVMASGIDKRARKKAKAERRKKAAKAKNEKNRLRAEAEKAGMLEERTRMDQ